MCKVLREVIFWPMAILACLSLAGMIHSYWPRPFAQERWQSGGEIYRGSMVQDLIDRQGLVGKPRREVLDLLGEPNNCFANLHSVACTDRNVGSLEYRFKARKCHLFWGCALEIQFDTRTFVVDSVTVNTD